MIRERIFLPNVCCEELRGQYVYSVAVSPPIPYISSDVCVKSNCFRHTQGLDIVFNLGLKKRTRLWGGGILEKLEELGCQSRGGGYWYWCWCGWGKGGRLKEAEGGWRRPKKLTYPKNRQKHRLKN